MKKLLAWLILGSSLVYAQVNNSPNMGLPIPIPGVTPGPNWAVDVAQSLLQVDSHNHSAGQGVQIQPNGLNINADLTFQGNNATSLRTTRFVPQMSPISNSGVDTGELYVSGNELYYNDVTGSHQVQITSNGLINATSSGISSPPASASFSGGTLVVLSNVNVPANIKGGSILLGNGASWPNFVTLQPPASISPAYSLTLPTIPGAQSFVTLDTSGNLSASVNETGGITNNMLFGNINALNKILPGTQIQLETVSKSTSYDPLPADGIVQYNTGIGSLSANLYSVSGSPGYTIRIKKTSSDNNILTVYAHSGDTINGAASTTLAVNQELIELTNDGANNWNLISRTYPVGWIDGGAITLTGTTSNPTKGSTGGLDHIYYRREGPDMIIRIAYRQTSGGGGGGNGVGSYLVALPGGWSAGPFITTDNSTGQPATIKNNVGTGTIQPLGGAAFGVAVILYDTTHMDFQGNDSSGGFNVTFWGDGTSAGTQWPTGNTTQLSVNANARIPISGWQ